MAHFQFESTINDLVKLDAPMLRCPAPRWQRKAMDKDDPNHLALSPLRLSKLKTPKTTSRRCSYKNNFTPNKTPKKTPMRSQGKAKPLAGKSKTPAHGVNYQGDRFIPNRSEINMAVSNFKLTAGSNSQNSSGPESQASGDEDQQQQNKKYSSTMAHLLNDNTVQESKILKFKKNAPRVPEGFSNNLKVLYTSNCGSTTKCKSYRQIPQNADRIMDAPQLRDDYYLTLMDWGLKNLIAVGLDNEVYLWNANNGEITHLLQMENPDEYVSCVSWIAEGNVLAVSNSLGQVQLWDVEKEKCLRTMSGHAARVGSLSWNSFLLSSGSRSGAIHQHDVRIADHRIATLNNHTQEVCGLQWSHDGKYLASGGNDNLLNIWGGGLGNDTTPIHSFTQHQAAVKALAWCPWQPYLLASGGGTADRHIRFWNCNTGSSLNNVDTNSQVSALLWSHEHRELISSHGYSQFQLTIWKYPTMAKVTELKGHTNRILSMCLSPDGTKVMSAAADETLRLWRTFEGLEKQKKTTSKNKHDMRSSIITKGIR
ncbi:cell division cycle protein 20 homolog [Anneissia japonica]|uniref:cell division cycle protein 20 homolog n=1 Tax=Anneissia japonica TaxID=1529436 RepID=UPI001425A6D1|nr:cell division cycle protein 20 homolog [Anneissia japonica]